MKQAEKWQKDLAVYQDINTTFIVEGNVHDLQPWIYEDDGTFRFFYTSAHHFYWLFRFSPFLLTRPKIPSSPELPYVF